MKKTLVGAAICAALIFGSSGAAFAGEVNGNGNATPVSEKAKSECAFSGLEDGTEDPAAPKGPGVVQNWGAIPKVVRDQISQFGAHPGEACNASRHPAK